jgi:hypothetical protein
MVADMLQGSLLLAWFIPRDRSVTVFKVRVAQKCPMKRDAPERKIPDRAAPKRIVFPFLASTRP